MGPVSAEEMQAASFITGAAMVAFLLAGRVGPRAQALRGLVLTLYVIAAAAMILFVLIR